MFALLFNDDLCAVMLLGKFDPSFQILKVIGCDWACTTNYNTRIFHSVIIMFSVDSENYLVSRNKIPKLYGKYHT